MNKKQLLELLKENLTIDICDFGNWEGGGYEVKIKFDGEEVCSDYIITERY